MVEDKALFVNSTQSSVTALKATLIQILSTLLKVERENTPIMVVLENKN
jgi:hypothetical protein